MLSLQKRKKGDRAEMENIIDACGLSCPEPVLMVKKALASKGKNYEVLVDNRTAMENVSRFSTNSGYNVEVKSDGGIYHLMLNLK